MNQNDFGLFEQALNELACGYLLKVEGDELAAYFRALARFPIETVLYAMVAAPQVHPTFFPKVGELIFLCYEAPSEQRNAVSSVAAIKAAAECDHDFVFEAEPEGAFFSGFDVCQRCGKAVPRVSPAAKPAEVLYFNLALAGAPSGEEVVETV